jgi:prevent-host-death family protein
MGERAPTTRTMNATEARAQWSKLLKEVFRGNGPVMIEKSGIPVAAVISVRDFERWRRLEEDRERRFAIIDEVRAAFSDVPDDELEREIERAIAEVRAENRRRAQQSTGVA